MDRDGPPNVFSSSSNIVGWQRPKFANYVLKSFFLALKKPTFRRKFTFWIFYGGGSVGGVTELGLFFGSFPNGDVWYKKSQQLWAMRHYGEGLKAKCLWNMENGISVFRKDSLPPISNISSPLCLRSMDRKWGPAECPKQIQTNDLEIQFFEVQYVDNIRCFLVLIWDNKLM